MIKRKKLVGIFLALIFAFSSIPAGFATAFQPNTEEEQIIATTSDSSGNINVLDGRISDLLRSTAIPKDFHDLSKSNYNADLKAVVVRLLYTNYYFKPNASNEIHVSWDVAAEGNPIAMHIYCYDMDEKKVVTSWTTGEISSDGSNGEGGLKFYYLNPDHKYAVAFQSAGLITLTGSAVIHH